MNIEEILKAAETEADWLRYYGNSETRLSEKFEDCNFYDRIKSIGRTKRVITLANRCAMMRVTSDKPVLESSIDELISISQVRNHDKNIYTALEYLIVNKIEVEKLIKIIRGNV